MFKKSTMPIPRLSLRAFSAAIAQAVRGANEQLERNHLAALLRYGKQADILPPPPPLMIRSAKVTFSGNVSDSGMDGPIIDWTNPNKNFSAELEFVPLNEEVMAELTRRREYMMDSPNMMSPQAPGMASPPAPGMIPPPAPDAPQPADDDDDDD